MSRMKRLCIVLLLVAGVGRSYGQDTQACKCIKNVNGVCVTLSRRGMPRFSRGSGTQFQFLPTCVDDCLPGSTLTTGPDAQTKKELARCYVDWKRLQRINPQWRDPNWTP